MRRRRWIWIIIVVAVLVLAGLVAGRMRGGTRAQVAPPIEQAVPVEVASVTRTTLEQTVEVSGSLTSARLASVFPRRAGRVERVAVAEGSRVEAGQPLVILDATEVAARVRQAEAAARAAEAQFALVRAGARPEEIAQAEEGVRQARAGLAAAEARLQALQRGARTQEVAQAAQAVRRAESALASARSQRAHAQVTVQTREANLQRMEALLKEGAVSQSQVDLARWEADQARTQLRSAEAAVQSAEAELSAARQQLSLVQAGPRVEEIEAAAAQRDQAKAALASAQQQLALLRRGPRQEEVRAAAAQRDQALAALAEAREALADTIVRAPFGGRVARLRVSPGDFISSGDFAGGTPVAVVYDDQALEADVTVGEREAGLLRRGQPATLRPEVASGLTVAAAVKTITPLAEAGSRSVHVRLRLLGAADERLIPGTFVRGRIVVARRVGVLTVPRAAVRDGGKTVVWVAQNGVMNVRPVKTGLIQGTRVEITAGVREGEQVIVLAPEALADGTKIRIVNQRTR